MSRSGSPSPAAQSHQPEPNSAAQAPVPADFIASFMQAIAAISPKSSHVSAVKWPILSSCKFDDLLAFERLLDECTRTSPDEAPKIKTLLSEDVANFVRVKTASRTKTRPAAVVLPDDRDAMITLLEKAMRPPETVIPQYIQRYVLDCKRDFTLNASRHVVTFERLLSALELPDSVRPAHLLRSLRGPLATLVQDRLSISDPVHDLQGLIDIVLDRAEYLDEHQSLKLAAAAPPEAATLPVSRAAAPSSSTSSSFSASSSSAAEPSPRPATPPRPASPRIPKLDEAARAQCVAEHRCFRCREVGHCASACPNFVNAPDSSAFVRRSSRERHPPDVFSPSRDDRRRPPPSAPARHATLSAIASTLPGQPKEISDVDPVRPIMNALLFGTDTKIPCLVDTGASASFVSEEFIDKLLEDDDYTGEAIRVDGSNKATSVVVSSHGHEVTTHRRFVLNLELPSGAAIDFYAYVVPRGFVTGDYVILGAPEIKPWLVDLDDPDVLVPRK